MKRKARGGSESRLRTRPARVVLQREDLLHPLRPSRSSLEQRQKGLANLLQSRIGGDRPIPAVEPVEGGGQVEQTAPGVQEEHVQGAIGGQRSHGTLYLVLGDLLSVICESQPAGPAAVDKSPITNNKSHHRRKLPPNVQTNQVV